MKKLTVILSIILVCCLAACAAPEKIPVYDITPPPEAEVYRPEVGIGVSIEVWEINYDIANKKDTASDDIRCYKVLKVVRLPNPEKNIWVKAGLEVGDYIAMVESRDGFMATLQCKNTDASITKWFPGKVGDNICSNWMGVRTRDEECKSDPNGFWIERLRFENDGYSLGTLFSLETLQVIYE